MAFELCCFNVESALLGVKHNVSRIELCADRAVDGVTPSVDDVRRVREAIDAANEKKQMSRNTCSDDDHNHCGAPRTKLQVMLRPSPTLTCPSVVVKSIGDGCLGDVRKEGGGGYRWKDEEPVDALEALLRDASPFIVSAPRNTNQTKLADLRHVAACSPSSARCCSETVLTLLEESIDALLPLVDGFVLGFLRVVFWREGHSEGAAGSSSVVSDEEHFPKFPLSGRFQKSLEIAKAVEHGGSCVFDWYWRIEVDWDVIAAVVECMNQKLTSNTQSDACCVKNETNNSVGEVAQDRSLLQNNQQNDQDALKEEELNQYRHISLTFHRAIDILFRQEEIYRGEKRMEREFPHVASVLERLIRFGWPLPATVMAHGNQGAASTTKACLSQCSFDRVLTSGGPSRVFTKNAGESNDEDGLSNIISLMRTLSRLSEDQTVAADYRRFCSSPSPPLSSSSPLSPQNVNFAVMIGGGVSCESIAIIRERLQEEEEDETFSSDIDDGGQNGRRPRDRFEKGKERVMRSNNLLRIFHFEFHGSLLRSTEDLVPTDDAIVEMLQKTKTPAN